MSLGLPYTDVHVDLMAVLMGKTDMPLLFPRMWRHEVDYTHRWSNIILKPVLLLLSYVYETDGLCIPLCIVMTWWLTGLYFGHETHMYFLTFNGHQGANLHYRLGLYRNVAVKGYSVNNSRMDPNSNHSLSHYEISF